jgi:simple sugar transport system permease protein
MGNAFFIVRMIPSALMIASPVLIAAAGGLVSERSGIVNIALEGLMTFGAMTAAIAHVLLESSVNYSVPAALFLASFAGGFFSIIHAFACVTLNADHVISGTGINLLSGGITVFVCQLLFKMDRSPHYRLGMRSSVFGIYPTIWIALLVLALVWFVLYKRRFGLRLRAAGENPHALACAGVNVKRIQYAALPYYAACPCCFGKKAC